jgi:hypothetical protein
MDLLGRILFHLYLMMELNRDSSVGIATGYRLDGRGVGVRVPVGPTQPPIQWVLGALSPGVKRPVCVADHSPPSDAEVKNDGSMPPLPRKCSWHST